MAIDDVIARFSKARIAVVGDVLLDRFLIGDISRISPEAPVPIVHISDERDVPGGAGNVCQNVASFGAHALLISQVGRDGAGARLTDLLVRGGSNVKGVVTDSTIMTPEKNRLMARGQHVVRFDRERSSPIRRATETRVIEQLRKCIPTCDAVIVSDYEKGFITERMARTIIQVANKHDVPVLVDTKPRHVDWFVGAFLIAPNVHEACEMSGVTDIIRAGELLQHRIRSRVIVTQGSQGMRVFDGKERHHVLAQSKEVFDVVGAGDTVMAVLALSLASGGSLLESAQLANLAAGIVVGKPGTATVSIDELLASIRKA